VIKNKMVKQNKCYRCRNFARSDPTRFRAKNKTSLLKDIKKRTPIFAKGKTTTDFVEVSC